MEQYRTDAEIYAVLEREIIDLTIRPGSLLSENPLCSRFAAPRSMIRVVLQKLQENGLVKIVPYKGTTVTRLNRRIVDELYEADRALHGTWFAAMDKMYLWSTLQNAHADYSRFRMLDTITSGGLAEVIADHRSLLDAIERCDLAAFEPLVEKHLYGGIRRLGSKLTEEYADYFEPEK